MIGIYGVNGFLGRHTLRRLVSRGYDVKGVSRRISTDLLESIGDSAILENVDISHELAVGSSLLGVDTVVQLVSTSSPGLQNSFMASDIRENVIPHIDFIRSALNAGVRRYVFLSSGGTVYGPQLEIPIPEDAPTKPISSHGLTKLVIEKYLQMYGHVDNLEFVILRLANPFGPGQVFSKGQGLIPALIHCIRRDEPVKIFGQGSDQRDYIYIEDVIDAIEAAIVRPEASKQILNIGCGKGRSVLDIIESIEKIIERPVKRENFPARVTDVDINVLDISRAKKVLNWEPTTDFMDGLARTVRGQL